MKALELEKGLIFKEGKRFIDREANTVTIIYDVKIKYGVAVTAELESKTTTIQTDINKQSNPALWKFIKDISHVDMMKFILANKDFKYLQIDSMRSDANEKEFRYLSPFYNTVFPFINKFSNIKIIDI